MPTPRPQDASPPALGTGRHGARASHAPDAPGTPRGRLGGPAFGRVRAYVEEHVGRHLSLEELAGVAGFSRFHFARLFRSRTGESPMGFVLRTRVERAKALLARGDARVGEVAAALGFADHSHLTRTFRRLVGTSPQRYSRAQRAATAPRPPRGRSGSGSSPGGRRDRGSP